MSLRCAFSHLACSPNCSGAQVAVIGSCLVPRSLENATAAPRILSLGNTPPKPRPVVDFAILSGDTLGRSRDRSRAHSFPCPRARESVRHSPSGSDAATDAGSTPALRSTSAKLSRAVVTRLLHRRGIQQGRPGNSGRELRLLVAVRSEHFPGRWWCAPDTEEISRSDMHLAVGKLAALRMGPQCHVGEPGVER